MTTDENSFKKSAKVPVEAQAPAPAQHIDPYDDDFNLDQFLERSVSNPLAVPGKLPGFELLWASKSVQGDIAQRKQVGYEIVHPSEFPHYQYSDSESRDEITVNEMVLMKIRTERWNEIMHFLYRKEPDKQVAGLRAEVLARARAEALENGVNGFDTLVGRQKPARFM